MPRNDKWRILVGVLLCACAGQCIAAPFSPTVGARYSPPELPPVSQNQLDVIGVEIAQNHIGDAAARLDGLLHDSPDAILTNATDGSSVSLSVWIAQLPADQRTALAREYAVRFEDSASRALRKLNDKTTAEPAEYLAIARRYPFAPSAADAIAGAARRSNELGDTHAAADLLVVARGRGFNGRIDAGAEAVSEPAIEPTGQPATQATMQPGDQLSYRGLLPYDAAWYAPLVNVVSPLTNAASVALQAERYFPVVCNGTVYIGTERHILAVRETGAMRWTAAPFVEPGDEQPVPRRAMRTKITMVHSLRGPSFSPALLCDNQGEARIVIARQLGRADNEFQIRAVRASDGKLLWATDNVRELAGLSIASNPSVNGRFVYALAADTGDVADRLALIALESTTGRLLWRSEIGTVAHRGGNRTNRARDPILDAPDPWQNLTAPGVDEQSVYVAPNVGCCIAIDRFDGHLEWIRSYEQIGVQADWNPHAAVGAQIRAAKRNPQSRMSAMRWSNTPVRCGQAIVVAPQDSDRVLALDALAGSNLWHTDSLPTCTLIGAVGKSVFLADRSIVALDVEKLDATWTWDGGATGPAAVSLLGDLPRILVPTGGGVIALGVNDGAVAPIASLRVPELKNLLKSDDARHVLQEAQALEGFLTDGGNKR